jgi:hypothetical protein
VAHNFLVNSPRSANPGVFSVLAQHLLGNYRGSTTRVSTGNRSRQPSIMASSCPAPAYSAVARGILQPQRELYSIGSTARRCGDRSIDSHRFPPTGASNRRICVLQPFIYQATTLVLQLVPASTTTKANGANNNDLWICRPQEWEAQE